ncbi:hypothetical protein [Nocardia africana]|uniref:Uncharacterized protein n=1 Tax=Nocardia africana TaxID=134964 RepID=A0A378WUM9_9NOCA|nr:hypothetical protein [Nocardia africana]MCC3313652.1 hypothetical protein [Nocardia africana]SUA44966.1 Uncharacterised protein [Nocardia africana]
MNSDKAARELNWTMRPVEDSLPDTAESLIAFGLVAASRPARSAAA